MIDWGLMECLIVIGIFIFFIVVAGIIMSGVELYNRLKSYEKPIQQNRISPRDWKNQEDSWDDRIMRG